MIMMINILIFIVREITTDISGSNWPTKVGELKSITYYGFEPCVAKSKNIYNEENILITWLELPEQNKGFPISLDILER